MKGIGAIDGSTELICGFKQSLLDSLISVVKTHLHYLEDDKDDITLEEATARTNDLLKFYNTIMMVNNIDL